MHSIVTSTVIDIHMLCYGSLVRFRRMNIKAALIDLSGTLHVEDEPTPNAVTSLQRLRSSGVTIKFVTNTTKDSKKTLFNRLQKIGFELDIAEIYSSLTATAEFVVNEKLNPYYLLSNDARSDFPQENTSLPLDSVVVGMAPSAFDYQHINTAFQVLLENKSNKLVAVHQGKYYRRADGLALGPGCYVKGLEYATGTKPILIGKPNSYFFKNAVPDGLVPSDCVMIGDDATDDIEGAMLVGLKGIQVKTGKYLPEAVAAISKPPTVIVKDFNEAVQWILSHN